MSSMIQASFRVLSLPSRDAILVSHLLTQFPLPGLHTVGQDLKSNTLYFLQHSGHP